MSCTSFITWLSFQLFQNRLVAKLRYVIKLLSIARSVYKGDVVQSDISLIRLANPSGKYNLKTKREHLLYGCAAALSGRNFAIRWLPHGYDFTHLCFRKQKWFVFSRNKQLTSCNYPVTNAHQLYSSKGS